MCHPKTKDLHSSNRGEKLVVCAISLLFSQYIHLSVPINAFFSAETTRSNAVSTQKKRYKTRDFCTVSSIEQWTNRTRCPNSQERTRAYIRKDNTRETVQISFQVPNHPSCDNRNRTMRTSREEKVEIFTRLAFSFSPAELRTNRLNRKLTMMDRNLGENSKWVRRCMSKIFQQRTRDGYRASLSRLPDHYRMRWNSETELGSDIMLTT